MGELGVCICIAKIVNINIYLTFSELFVNNIFTAEYLTFLFFSKCMFYIRITFNYDDDDRDDVDYAKAKKKEKFT